MNKEYPKTPAAIRTHKRSKASTQHIPKTAGLDNHKSENRKTENSHSINEENRRNLFSVITHLVAKKIGEKNDENKEVFESKREKMFETLWKSKYQNISQLIDKQDIRFCIFF